VAGRANAPTLSDSGEIIVMLTPVYYHTTISS
jgi:hypothetical protein